jgi:hypothetical protein
VRIPAGPPAPRPESQAATGESAHAGLWIGDAVLNAVSQPAQDPSVTRTAGGNFSFRLVVHVDGAGTARLLQQVFLVRKPPSWRLTRTIRRWTASSNPREPWP